MPVIHTTAFHIPPDRVLGDVKPQGADQMQAAAGGGAGPGDIAAVLRNFRLHQYDIEHRPEHSSPHKDEAIVTL